MQWVHSRVRHSLSLSTASLTTSRVTTTASHTTSGMRLQPSLALAAAKCNKALPHCALARLDDLMVSSLSAALAKPVGVPMQD